MTKFRPCIDLHNGKVKQIVGSTLVDSRHPSKANETTSKPTENFVSEQSANWFATKYQNDKLTGGHVIKLGMGNDQAAESALAAYPSGLQIGGGINASNAQRWLDEGASHVIVTSWLFDEHGAFQTDRLRELVGAIGKHRIVIDLSCKRTPSGWTVAMNRWQTLTDLDITHKTLDSLADHCDEFLIHAADVEGLCKGIDVELVETMGSWAKIPMTYAGGVANMQDVERVASASNGKIDVTVGSALDLFGGSGVQYQELVKWNSR
ncbi:MAG: phosphoribosylformimino-5-aminoimidazole carboxamide ribotide isomerase [Mariniblastus sp.]